MAIQFLGVDILKLFLTILMNLLCEHQMRGMTLKQKLHDFSLEKVLKIGPSYASEFRLIMTQSPHFKGKLESAIKNQKNNHHQTRSCINDQNMSETEKRGVTATPVIKLKTDFSNFK